MRTLFLLRGAPGSGKSTWIRENNLEPYTISADSIRLLYCGPIITNNGAEMISQQYDGAVWKTLLERLEERMDRGEFVIVDATHYRAALLTQYKKLVSKYRYRAYVVDFTDIPKEQVLKQNKERDLYKFVPEEVIEKQYAVFASSYKEVSNMFKILTRDQALTMLYESMLYDFNHYKRIYVFGDIHGCYEPVRKFFEENPYKEENAYIFVGDYLDRGIQNKEVVQFLLDMKDKSNVMLLEGNHERWLRMYAEDKTVDITEEDRKVLEKYVDKDFWNRLRKQQIRNNGFIKFTAPQLESFDKKDLRQLCRKFMQMAYFDFHGKHYFITHGGIPVPPRIDIPTSQYIEGTGKYEDLDTLYDSWLKNTEENDILIHGHRNTFGIQAKQRGGRCWNLDNGVEYGKPLRIMKITEKQIRVLEYENPVYDTELQQHPLVQPILAHTENELLQQLNESKLVTKKTFGNGITSYNFTRRAFYDRKWNQLTCTARGLFVKDDKVVARSYDKFFNWGELDMVSSKALHEKLEFPVTAYQKENGFLAILSSFEGELLVCSKSSLGGDYVGYINAVLDKLGDNIRKDINTYCAKHNVSFVCECVDPINDPHIIKYNKEHLYLLDIVKNDFKYEALPFKKMVAVADEIGLEHKVPMAKFNTWDELYSYRQKTKQLTPENLIANLCEGVVLVDANGFMVKMKFPEYTWWKSKRTILNSLNAGHYVKPVYTMPQDIKVFELMNQLKEEGKLQNMSIIDVQDAYRNKLIKSQEDL